MNIVNTWEERCNDMRAECKVIEKKAREMMNADTFRNEQTFAGQHDEMKANIMLAVRHLEDARMRLGKAIQYAGDGVSCFDK